MSAMNTLRALDPSVIHEAYTQTGSIEGVGRLLGISTRARCVREYIKHATGLVDPTVLRVISTKSTYTLDDIAIAVGKSTCMSDVLRKLNLTTHGSNAVVIKRLMVEHGIDFSHFDVGGAMQRNKHRWTDEQIFVEHSPLPRASLHAQVVRRGVLGYPKCVECGITNEYNNKPIKLTVDHINGISDDNRVINLRWLCHNCHSQTPTYGGKGSNMRNTK